MAARFKSRRVDYGPTTDSGSCPDTRKACVCARVCVRVCVWCIYLKGAERPSLCIIGRDLTSDCEPWSLKPWEHLQIVCRWILTSMNNCAVGRDFLPLHSLLVNGKGQIITRQWFRINARFLLFPLVLSWLKICFDTSVFLTSWLSMLSSLIFLYVVLFMGLDW